MLNYLDRNHFDDVYKGPGDNFFGTLSASRPEIFPIYWSQAQMQARQSEEMANVQSFLNRLWTFARDGKQWFDPDVSVIYPDRIRRRPPGTTSKGLGAHTDSGALERWLLPAYQRVFANVFNGNLAKYDPWDAAYRTDVEEYTVDNTTKCSVFRTFQGWTALSDMLPGQGLLHVVPIPEAMAYLLLRPLLDDVPDDELCGVAPGRVLPVSEPVASAVDGGADQHSATRSRGLRLVALRRDPRCRPGRKPAGLGKRDVYSRRAHVRKESGVRAHGKSRPGERRIPGRFPT